MKPSSNLQTEVARGTDELEKTKADLDHTLVERRTELDSVKQMYTCETEALARAHARADFAKEQMAKASAQMDQLAVEIEEFTTLKSRGKIFAKKAFGFARDTWRSYGG